MEERPIVIISRELYDRLCLGNGNLSEEFIKRLISGEIKIDFSVQVT